MNDEMMVLESFNEIPTPHRKPGRRTIYDFTKIPPGHRGGWPFKAERGEDFEKVYIRKAKTVNGALGAFKKNPGFAQLNADNEYMLRTDKDPLKREGMVWVYCVPKLRSEGVS